MKSKIWMYLIIFGMLLNCIMVFVPSGGGEVWENDYGYLEVTPDVSRGIVTQVQYCNLTSYVDDTSIDVTFRFDIPVGNPDIWMWRNISHQVRVPDYGMVESNYTLVNISRIEFIGEPNYVDFGDIPSNYYRWGVASYWDDMGEWFNGTFIIGFDSFEWLNPEHTEAKFYYEYYGVTGYHWEEQYWFDWDNIKDLFNHVEYNDKHYYYVRSWMIKDRLYQFKWQYDVPLGSSGKWDLLAKKSGDSLGTWRVSIDPWWDSDWQYFKTVEVADKIDDYQMKILIDYNADVGGNVSCAGHCQTDFDDIRFVYNNATELPYWLENYTASTQATFWVNNSGNYSSFELFYGNDAVGNNSDGDTTFDFFDDFETDLNKWYARQVGTTFGTISATKSFQNAKSVYMYNAVTDVQQTRNISTEPCVVMCWMWDDNNDVDVSVRAIVLWNAAINSYYLVGVFGATSQTKYFYRDVDGRVATNVDRTSGWHKFEMRIGDSDTSLYIDNTYVDTSDDITGSTIAKIEIFENQANPIANYIDCYIVRKFTSDTEPSWSVFGSEQEYPYPPYLSNEYPTDESIYIDTVVELHVTCIDNNSDTMVAHWRSNSSSSWVDFATNTSITTTDVIYQTNINFSAYSTMYWWSVNLTDGTGLWDNETYSFTTRPPNNPPTVSNLYPSNSSIGVCPISLELGVTVSDIDGNLMNITFWSNLSVGVWDWFYTGHPVYTINNVTNGTYYFKPVFFVLYNYTYYWNVSVDDGQDESSDVVMHFITTDSSGCGSGGGGGFNMRSTSIIGLLGLFGLLGCFFMYRRRKL